MGQRGAVNDAFAGALSPPGRAEKPRERASWVLRDSTSSSAHPPHRHRPARLPSTRCSPAMAAQPPHVADHLIVDQPAEHILRLTLNRPDKLNAMHNALEDDIGRVLDWFEVRSFWQGVWADPCRPSRRFGSAS